jgi:psp operon transcriptional activator
MTKLVDFAKQPWHNLPTMAQMATEVVQPVTPLGESPAFRDMLAQVSVLAPLDRPVLVLGERGTGKELVAGRLAYLSRRWDRPYLTLNCAALSESLLDAELFGHEAGAFTGAVRRRAGRFEAADGGTLFLDEIGTASAAVQEKLLRVLEYGAFDRVGGNATQRVDVRIIAATNADLPALTEAGRFRADLLDRLAFDVVCVPPLRARGDDVMLLAEHFARRMAAELGRDLFPGFGPAALAQLAAHDWPGNVRELRNAVERSLVRETAPRKKLDRIVVDPFPAWAAAAVTPVQTGAEPRDFRGQVAAFSAGLLGRALSEAGGNQRRASALLGLSYYQFRHQLKLHQLA